MDEKMKRSAFVRLKLCKCLSYDYLAWPLRGSRGLEFNSGGGLGEADDQQGLRPYHAPGRANDHLSLLALRYDVIIHMMIYTVITNIS